ncbi:hypothetical protein JCM10213_008104 [Rhodosporidiobolus nylandii]
MLDRLPVELLQHILRFAAPLDYTPELYKERRATLRTHVGRRDYSSPASGLSEGHGKPTTSTAHPTVPHAPPEPTPFFAPRIALAARCYVAGFGTIIILATLAP